MTEPTKSIQSEANTFGEVIKKGGIKIHAGRLGKLEEEEKQKQKESYTKSAAQVLEGLRLAVEALKAGQAGGGDVATKDAPNG